VTDNLLKAADSGMPYGRAVEAAFCVFGLEAARLERAVLLFCSLQAAVLADISREDAAARLSRQSAAVLRINISISNTGLTGNDAAAPCEKAIAIESSAAAHNLSAVCRR